jgi:hypothetical protein
MACSELRFIHPDELATIWELIRPGIQRVKDVGSEPWIVEDVYASLKSGASSLYVGYLDSDYVGFVVLMPIKDWGRMTLHIWLLFNASTHDVIGLFWPEIQRLARSIGATKIAMQTARNGFERRLAEYGFKTEKLFMACEV